MERGKEKTARASTRGSPVKEKAGVPGPAGKKEVESGSSNLEDGSSKATQALPQVAGAMAAGTAMVAGAMAAGTEARRAKAKPGKAKAAAATHAATCGTGRTSARRRKEKG